MFNFLSVKFEEILTCFFNFVQRIMSALLVTRNAKVQLRQRHEAVFVLAGCVMVIMIVAITGMKARLSVVSVRLLVINYLTSCFNDQ